MPGPTGEWTRVIAINGNEVQNEGGLNLYHVEGTDLDLRGQGPPANSPGVGETVTYTVNATVTFQWDSNISGGLDETVTCSKTTTFTRPQPPQPTIINCSTVGPTIDQTLFNFLREGIYFTTTCETPGYTITSTGNVVTTYTMRNYIDGIEYEYWDYNYSIVMQAVNGALVITDKQTFFNAIDTALTCPLGTVVSWDYALTVELSDFSISNVSTHSGSYVSEFNWCN
jgi:hypothetical protein